MCQHLVSDYPPLAHAPPWAHASATKPAMPLRKETTAERRAGQRNAPDAEAQALKRALHNARKRERKAAQAAAKALAEEAADHITHLDTFITEMQSLSPELSGDSAKVPSGDSAKVPSRLDLQAPKIPQWDSCDEDIGTVASEPSACSAGAHASAQVMPSGSAPPASARLGARPKCRPAARAKKRPGR